MLSYNHVVIIGNLTRNPDVKIVGTGMKLAHFCVCINEKRRTQDGRILDSPTFIDVDAWSRLADMCEKYLEKNSSVFVEGKLQMAQWEKNGVKHQKIKIRASNVKFFPKGNRLNAKKDGANSGKFPRTDFESEDAFIPDEGIEDGGADNDIAETISGW